MKTFTKRQTNLFTQTTISTIQIQQNYHRLKTTKYMNQ